MKTPQKKIQLNQGQKTAAHGIQLCYGNLKNALDPLIQRQPDWHFYR